MTIAVGLLHYTAPPVVGGVEAVLGQHARLLAAAGHRVRVMAGRGGPLPSPIETVRIPLLDARSQRLRATRAELDDGRVPKRFDGLVRTLIHDLGAATAGLDVLVAHNVCTMPFDLPASVALRRLVEAGAAPPLVAWTHDLAVASPALRHHLHPGDPWDAVATAWPGTTMVAVSEARRDDLAAAFGLPAEAIPVVPDGIDRDRFLGLHPATRRLLAELALTDAGPVFLTPARIIPRKNLELAIAIVERLRRGGDDARLIVTGAPDPHDRATHVYLDQLHALAAASGVAGAVHFLADHRPGGATARVTADLYRVADALLLPSLDEGFGLPIIEAAVCRLPVACADLPSLRELAGPQAVYFDPAGDPAIIAGRIRERLGRDRALRLARRVRDTFDWAAIYARQIEPLLLEVAARGRARALASGRG